MDKKMRIMVVGATSGLGRGLAERYIAEGHVVGIAGRRLSLLEEVSGGRSNVYSAVADVTDIRSVTSVLQDLLLRMGGMDCLVMCSGVGYMNPELDVAPEQITVDTNVRGWTAVVDWAFGRFMQQGYGHLAAISSVAGIRGLAPAPAYSASKAYQIHYLDALRQRADISGGKVKVTDIRPGFVATPLLSAPEKFFWVVSAEKAVKAIYRAIDEKKRRAVVTRRWAMLAPMMKIAPEWLVRLILSKA